MKNPARDRPALQLARRQAERDRRRRRLTNKQAHKTRILAR